MVVGIGRRKFMSYGANFADAWRQAAPIHSTVLIEGRLPMPTARKSGLFDHLVGGGEQDWRNANAERLRGLEIDYQLKSRRLFYR